MKLTRRKSAKRSSRQSRQRSERSVPTAKSFGHFNRPTDQPRSSNVRRQTINRDTLKPAVHRARSFWVQRYGLVILLIALVFSAINIITLSNSPKIDVLKTTNGVFYVHPSSTYQQAASGILKRSIWNRNKITIDTTGVSAQMIAEFPELSHVSVTLPLIGHRPIVYLEPARPALIMHSSNGSFLLDSSGKALAAGAIFSDVNVPQVADQSGLPIKLNQQALTASDVSFIQTVVGQLSAKKLSISGLTLPAASSELDVQLSGQPYLIKFNLQSNDARQQVGRFLALQAHLAAQHITPGKYIDVRVDGRAYYL